MNYGSNLRIWRWPLILFVPCFLIFAQHEAVLIVGLPLYTICSMVLYFQDEEYPRGHWWRLKYVFAPIILPWLLLGIRHKATILEAIHAFWT